MNEKSSLKKSRNFYGVDDLESQLEHGNDYGKYLSQDEITEDMQEISDEKAVEEMVLKLVSDNVKEYCEKHFEEIIAGAIMLHDLKQKRKIVKAAKQNK